jgi:hypothetical protein
MISGMFSFGKNLGETFGGLFKDILGVINID